MRGIVECGNRQVGQYDFLQKYQKKICKFRKILQKVDEELKRASDFVEMWEFLQNLISNDSCVLRVIGKEDIFALSADWWLWKHKLRFPCYFCKYWSHTKYMYADCSDNDMEHCQKDWNFVYHVRNVVSIGGKCE